MGTFTPRVMRLLTDALFDDWGIPLGPPQPEGDESVQRERMRWYLVTLDLGDITDAQQLTAVFGYVLQTIGQDGSTG